MNINSLKISDITVSDLTHTPANNSKTNWIIDVTGDVEKQPLQNGDYVQAINVTVIKNESTSQLKMHINTVYHIEISGKITDVLTDQNFLVYSELLQVAMSHARAIFLQSCKGLGIKLQPFPADPSSSYFTKLKSGYYKLWN